MSLVRPRKLLTSLPWLVVYQLIITYEWGILCIVTSEGCGQFAIFFERLKIL
jgi:hypothetical protein